MICPEKVKIQPKHSGTLQKSLGLYMTIDGGTEGIEQQFKNKIKRMEYEC